MPLKRRVHWHIAFDLDGTLIDSSPGIVNAYRVLCEEIGIPLLNESQIRRLIGPSIDVILRREFKLNDEEAEAAKQIFRQSYINNGLFQYYEYRGISEAIRKLKNDGFNLCVVTNKDHQMASRLISEIPWGQHFGSVYGENYLGKCQNKAQIFEFLFRNKAISPGGTIMVTDRGDDIDIARNFGVRSIGVTWGYGLQEELVRAGASEIIQSPQEISIAVSRLLGHELH
jgi:phosphoglycolate phosphatase